VTGATNGRLRFSKRQAVRVAQLLNGFVQADAPRSKTLVATDGFFQDRLTGRSLMMTLANAASS